MDTDPMNKGVLLCLPFHFWSSSRHSLHSGTLGLVEVLQGLSKSGIKNKIVGLLSSTVAATEEGTRRFCTLPSSPLSSSDTRFWVFTHDIQPLCRKYPLWAGRSSFCLQSYSYATFDVLTILKYWLGSIATLPQRFTLQLSRSPSLAQVKARLMGGVVRNERRALCYGRLIRTVERIMGAFFVALAFLVFPNEFQKVTLRSASHSADWQPGLKSGTELIRR